MQAALLRYTRDHEVFVWCVTAKMACFMTRVVLFDRRYNETTLDVGFWSPKFSTKMSRIKKKN